MLQKKYIFLILAIIGILLLALISNIIQPEKLKISSITKADINKRIQLEANIKISYEKPGFQILTLSDKTGNITAITNSNKHISYNYSKIYLIQGKIQEYNSTLQINIDKITEK
jgi:hypothetical protein